MSDITETHRIGRKLPKSVNGITIRCKIFADVSFDGEAQFQSISAITSVNESAGKSVYRLILGMKFTM